MKIYTRKGDTGRTSLLHGQVVLKSDTRIELLGILDQLNAYIGLAKVQAPYTLKDKLALIQKNLMRMEANVADDNQGDYRLPESEVTKLEEWIDEYYEILPEFKGFILYGGCELSARLDVARACCRTAERRLNLVALNHFVDHVSLMYMNRLSDYLYAAARFADYKNSLNN